jgi:hypothetical protein
VKYDGSAEFATGNIQLDGTNGSAEFLGDLSINTDKVILDYRGMVSVKRGGTNLVWQGMNTDDNDAVTSKIQADGKAVFTQVKGGAYFYLDQNVDGGGYLRLTKEDKDEQVNQISGEAIRITRTGSDTSQTMVQIFANGDATFKGTITPSIVTFNLEADDPTKYDVTTEEYTETETYEVEVPVLRPEGVVGTADLVDEPKTRTVTKEREVTKTREVRTYNGPVLDVKSELQSLRARATQQDETIKLMTAALKSLGVDTANFPAPDNESTT